MRVHLRILQNICKDFEHLAGTIKHQVCRRRARHRAGLPWWCTSFQAPPCFSNTFVAAILPSGAEVGLA